MYKHSTHYKGFLGAGVSGMSVCFVRSGNHRSIELIWGGKIGLTFDGVRFTQPLVGSFFPTILFFVEEGARRTRTAAWNVKKKADDINRLSNQSIVNVTNRVWLFSWRRVNDLK